MNAKQIEFVFSVSTFSNTQPIRSKQKSYVNNSNMSDVLPVYVISEIKE